METSRTTVAPARAKQPPTATPEQYPATEQDQVVRRQRDGDVGRDHSPDSIKRATVVAARPAKMIATAGEPRTWWHAAAGHGGSSSAARRATG